MKRFWVIPILLFSFAASAQTESFAYKMPKPKNNTYHFEVVAGVGVGNIEAQNDACAKIRQSQADRLSIPFESVSVEMLVFACDSAASAAKLERPAVCEIPAKGVYCASSFMHFLDDGRNCIHMLFLVPDGADPNVRFDMRTFPKIWKWGKINGDIIMRHQEKCNVHFSYNQ